MRNIRVVIGKMIEAIPETEGAFIKRLHKLADDSVYQPPESNLYWFKLQDCLVHYMGIMPTEDWQWQVCSIFSTKSIEELKGMGDTQ
jgi:hypothetical protein